MATYRISLASLLLLTAAVPLWIVIAYMVATSPGFGGGVTRFVIPPIGLLIATAALYRLFRSMRDALALAALFAGAIPLCILISAAIWERFFS